jgi:LysR family transcriptional regulator, transcription activator of glutamate synthase operon
MDIEYFNSFLETANQKSLSKASIQLNISQPALSKQIRKLEEYFEMPLLHRSTSGVGLTEAGDLLYKRIPQILADLKSIKSDLQIMKEVKRYKIGTLPSLAGSYIPSITFKLKENGIDSDIFVKNTSFEVLDLLKKGELDVAITEKIAVNKAIWRRDIFEESFYAVVPNTHKFAKEKSVFFEEIANEEFVLYPPTCSIRQCISHLMEKIEGNLLVKTEVDFGEFLIGYVAAGGGITVVPEITAKYLGHPSVKAIPIKNIDARRQISIFSNSKTAGKFLYPFFKPYRH